MINFLKTGSLNNFKYSILLVTILLSACQSRSNPDPAGKLDTLVSVYAKQGKFNGSALVARNGIILLDKGYGYRNDSSKSLNTAQSIFQLGSITKQFTSAVILKLQEEKKLSVKDKLSKYFPQYPKGDSITIEQLLTHTSGVYNYTNDATFMTNEMTKPANREKMMAQFKDKPLDFPPGTGWNYSNSGYSLLGYIIEIATGKPYEQVVRDYIFTPLKMTNSGFDFTHLNEPDKATGYSEVGSINTAIAPIVDSSFSFSAGAIYSTTGDLYKWSNALENYSILSKAQEEMAYTVVKNNYGYGWAIDSIDGKRRVGHQGGIPGFRTIIDRVPVDDICIVLLSNGSDEALQEITGSIFSVLYNKTYELPIERKVIEVTEEKLKEYIGEYEVKPDFHLIVNIQDSHLRIDLPGRPASTLFAEKEDYFFVRNQHIQLQFTRNDKREVVGLILDQDGEKKSCKKIK